MAKVIMSGWKLGFQKIALVKLQQDSLNLGLKEAKDNVDLLLEGNVVELLIHDDAVEKEFVLKAMDLGVLFDAERL